MDCGGYVKQSGNWSVLWGGRYIERVYMMISLYCNLCALQLPYLRPSQLHSNWSTENQIKFNEDTCNYTVFSKAQEHFATRISINTCKLDQISVTQILGVWISEDLGWERNT